MRKEDDPQCLGKTKYVTAGKAHEQVKRRKRAHRIKNRAGRNCVRVYRCNVCHHYHIGSSAL
jgi:hypothetical protein